MANRKVMWLTAVKNEDSKIGGKEMNSNTKKCERMKEFLSNV